MTDRHIEKSQTRPLRLTGTKTIREPGFGRTETRVVKQYEEVPALKLSGRQLVSFFLCFLFLFALPRLNDFYLENGNIEDRTYSQNAVSIVEGDVVIDSESFDSFQNMEVPIMTLTESLDFFDRLSVVFSGSAFTISYETWEAKNLPWLASWGRASVDDDGFIGILKTIGYWLVSVFTRLWYTVVVRFAFIPDLINIISVFLSGEPVFLPGGVA